MSKINRNRPAAVAVCLCRQPLFPVATFVNGDLVSVVRRHWRRDGCPMPPESVDPKTYLRGL
jgi:hypothetical protein